MKLHYLYGLHIWPEAKRAYDQGPASRPKTLALPWPMPMQACMTCGHRGTVLPEHVAWRSGRRLADGKKLDVKQSTRYVHYAATRAPRWDSQEGGRHW
jgi:hypothetical protein